MAHHDASLALVGVHPVPALQLQPWFGVALPSVLVQQTQQRLASVQFLISQPWLPCVRAVLLLRALVSLQTYNVWDKRLGKKSIDAFAFALPR
ncbi:MAG: hypothetical protein ACKOE4_08510 [Candidatus Kapaibacterium sp.]